MAEKNVAPLFKLPKDVMDRLSGQGEEIDKAKRAIAVMKNLGMDTKELEDKLAWADNVRKTLLKEFA